MSFLITVEQRTVAIIERFGKYSRTLESGLQFKIPFSENVAYRMSLKEEALSLDDQTAITNDNVMVKISTVLYYKITDPVKAAY